MPKLFVMRNAVLTLVFFVATAMAAKAQRFTLLPQVGFENSKTSISYNKESFSPIGCKFSPNASLRLDYATKKGHGLFLGMTTSRSAVEYKFSDPETGMTSYTATAADMQLRFEGGYQFSSKPIYFNKSKASSTKTNSTSKTSTAKKSCGTVSKTSCSRPTESYSRCGSSKQKTTTQKNVAKGGWVRIQPSVGMGFVPTDQSGIEAKMENGQQLYQYTAGAWNTAVLGGLGFEFGKNKTRLLTLSLNYLKGLGNMDEQTLTAVSGTKTTTTTMSSKSSAWNLRVGIPFTLGSTKATKSAQKQEVKKKECIRYSVPSYRCRTMM